MSCPPGALPRRSSIEYLLFKQRINGEPITLHVVNMFTGEHGYFWRQFEIILNPEYNYDEGRLENEYGIDVLGGINHMFDSKVSGIFLNPEDAIDFHKSMPRSVFGSVKLLPRHLWPDEDTPKRWWYEREYMTALLIPELDKNGYRVQPSILDNFQEHTWR